MPAFYPMIADEVEGGTVISWVDHARRFVSLDSEQELLLHAAATPVTLGHRERLAEPGRSSWIFVTSGLVRVAHQDPRGKDRTLQFGVEGWWVFLPTDHARRADSGFFIQAVEESHVLIVSRERRNELLERLPSLERYFRLVFERMSEAALWRIHLTSRRDGERMYREFQRRYPEFLQRVPQSMLASFLGFTPEFLSKIRARPKRS